jgi:hypothetical protein
MIHKPGSDIFGGALWCAENTAKPNTIVRFDLAH